jgi:protein-S-isoprenylcysteine O-methyltransferase Ste14
MEHKPMTQPGSFIQYLVISATGLIGGGSLVLFLIFLYVGSFDWVNFGFKDPIVLAFDAILCILFFVQHSTMIRKSFKNENGLPKIIHAHYHGAFYSISSGTILLILIILWQDSHLYIFNMQDGIRTLFRIVFFGSIGLFAWGCLALGSFDFFGVGSILANIKGTKTTPIPFIVCGPYRWVRHPLYLATLLLIWSCPRISIDRLLFNILWTVWIVVATLLEERDLVDEFDEDYLDYQRKVPMLFPRRLRPIEVGAIS